MKKQIIITIDETGVMFTFTESVRPLDILGAGNLLTKHGFDSIPNPQPVNIVSQPDTSIHQMD
jgi:hypothetical protein